MVRSRQATAALSLFAVGSSLAAARPLIATEESSQPALIKRTVAQDGTVYTFLRSVEDPSELLPLSAVEVPDAHVMPLRRHDYVNAQGQLTARGERKARSNLRKRQASQTSTAQLPNFTAGTTNNVQALKVVGYGAEYSANVQIGGQTVSLIMDTGSADTWMVGSGFTCYDFDTGYPTTQSACLFGTPYYTPSAAFNSSIIQNQNLNITYGDGEVVTGVFGFDNVTVAGVTVRQQIAVVKQALWNGDGDAIGLMGLAQVADTSAFAGSDPTQDGDFSTAIHYNPIMITLFNTFANLSNIFTFSLARSTVNETANGGIMTVGGLPSQQQVPHATNFTSTPLVQIQQNSGGLTATSSSLSEYAIDVTQVALVANGRRYFSNSSFVSIVDTGTTLLMLPGQLASGINALFSPAATYNRNFGTYVVSCTATAPQLSLRIGGQLITIPQRDLIVQQGNNFCTSGVGDGGDIPYGILGDVFLKNVLAVFDLGATPAMHFAQRTS